MDAWSGSPFLPVAVCVCVSACPGVPSSRMLERLCLPVCAARGAQWAPLLQSASRWAPCTHCASSHTASLCEPARADHAVCLQQQGGRVGRAKLKNLSSRCTVSAVGRELQASERRESRCTSNQKEMWAGNNSTPYTKIWSPMNRNVDGGEPKATKRERTEQACLSPSMRQTCNSHPAPVVTSVECSNAYDQR